jgi:hypothetical protein
MLCGCTSMLANSLHIFQPANLTHTMSDKCRDRLGLTWKKEWCACLFRCDYGKREEGKLEEVERGCDRVREGEKDIQIYIYIYIYIYI